MNEDVNQPEQASPAEADAANEFAVYESEEPPELRVDGKRGCTPRLSSRLALAGPHSLGTTQATQAKPVHQLPERVMGN